MRSLTRAVGASLILVAMLVAAQSSTPTTRTLDDVYMDQSHCLTSPDMRSDKDAPISCFCRDDIEMARYVYFTYLLTGKDRNLNGIYLTLERSAAETCGQEVGVIMDKAEDRDWKWDGPEVVRTYPSDEVIDRINPEMKDGKPVGRWIPYTIQLVYRDVRGNVARTENYSSREFEPVLPK